MSATPLWSGAASLYAQPHTKGISPPTVNSQPHTIPLTLVVSLSNHVATDGASQPSFDKLRTKVEPMLAGTRSGSSSGESNTLEILLNTLLTGAPETYSKPANHAGV